MFERKSLHEGLANLVFMMIHNSYCFLTISLSHHSICSNSALIFWILNQLSIGCRYIPLHIDLLCRNNTAGGTYKCSKRCFRETRCWVRWEGKEWLSQSYQMEDKEYGNGIEMPFSPFKNINLKKHFFVYITIIYLCVWLHR